jgi:hypothetical protein
VLQLNTAASAAETHFPFFIKIPPGSIVHDWKSTTIIVE